MGGILTVNAGSSTLKFALFPAPDGAPSLRGLVDGIGGTALHLTLRDGAGAALAVEGGGTDMPPTHAGAVETMSRHLAAHSGGPPRAIGHRIVHGGAAFAGAVRLDDAVTATLAGLAPLAPLHQPHNLAAAEAMRRRHPDVPQIACFDTAFHHDQSPVERSYALPHEMTARGLRRYGFHGLSYAWIARSLPALDPAAASGRTVVAHLGAGASLCAMRRGRSVATTMGFTALEGVPMATRCGSVDPGLVLHLLDELPEGRAGVEDLLYRRSGLFGVSGVSGDMRALRASADPRAAFAIELFVHRIVQAVGALAATLEGLDALVFTGGIGENDAALRETVLRRLAWLGFEVDPEANAGGGPAITAPGPARGWVLHTDEERMIAIETAALLDQTRPWH